MLPFLKLLDPNDFAQAIANYKLLPDNFINILAIILPWIEISAGLLLLFGVSVKENSIIISGMLIIFIIAIAISLARGLNIDCGCFGTANGNELGSLKLFAKYWIAGNWYHFNFLQFNFFIDEQYPEN